MRTALFHLARRLLGPPPTPTVSVDEGYRLWSADYGDEPNELQRLEERAVGPLLGDLTGRRVLDLGCGRGRWGPELARLGAADVVGVDRSLAMLHRGSGRTVAADARALPFADARFDAVLCTLVLGHVPALEPALAEVARVLAPAGVAVVADFHPDATRRGWRRTVRDPASGREVAIEHHLHPLGGYRRTLSRLGLAAEALREAQWRGVPVVFALRARRPAPSGPDDPHTP